MNRMLVAAILLCMLGISSHVLAQTSSTTGSTGSTTGTTSSTTGSTGTTASSTSVGFPAEQYVFGNMTQAQQDQYMQGVLVSNLATQLLTASAYSRAEKKVHDSDPLTDFDRYILKRGPFAVLPGNQSFVPIGNSSTSSSSSSTGTTTAQ